MKRTLLILTLPLLLGGCAQIFDANLFQGIDQPPPLDTGALKKASVEDIQNRMSDDSFYQQLKDDPKSLGIVQNVLEKQFEDVSATSSESDKTAAVEAASSYVLVTANSTSVAEIKSAIGNNLVDLKQALAPDKNADGTTPDADFSKAFDAIVGNKSTSEVADTLNQMVAMSKALGAMQTASTVGTEVDSEAFLAGTDDPAGFSQLVLMAAAADALTQEYGGDADAAAKAIADGNVKATTDGSPLDLFMKALQGDQTDPSTNKYAYLNAVTGQLPVSF